MKEYKRMLRIGEISKLFQINIRTLRYYDEIGLLKPAYTDKETGYRYYSIEQFEQLNTIRYLRALDVPLNSIKAHLNERSIEHALNILENQKTDIEKKLCQIELIHKKLERRINQIHYSMKVQKDLGVIITKKLPSRNSVVLKHKIHPGDDLEYPIRILENRARMKDSIFLGEVGLSISAENMKAHNYREYNSVFLLFEGQAPNPDMVKVIPEGTYVTICFQGAHSDAPPYYSMLIDYIEKKGLKILEPSVEITLIDYGLTNDVAKFITEIQILVE